jgi:TolB-like protein
VSGFTPDTPTATVSANVAAGAAQRFAIGRDIPSEWWKVFHSKEIDALIAEALHANPSLQAAQTSLWQAKETLYASGGKRLPQVEMAANFVDAGQQSLKRVYRLDLVSKAATAPEAPSLPAHSDKPSIAVLAFNNMSGDPEQEYFSDGISEDIITDLSKLSELQVIARNSSFTYKGKPVDVKQVGLELGVRYVLEDSVRKAGNRIRVTGQLIDAASGAHIWADRFDRDLIDIFAMQDELTQEIIAALKIKLTATEKALRAGGGTENVEARDLFLKGRELVSGNKRSWDVHRSKHVSPARHRTRSELCRTLRGARLGPTSWIIRTRSRFSSRYFFTCLHGSVL